MQYTENEYVHVKDTHNKWCQAKIKTVTDNWVLIHYLCWGETFDERIPKEEWADRIQYNRAYTTGGRYQENQRIDIYDNTLKRWLSGFIREVDADIAVVHYNGYHEKFDEVINSGSWRIQPYGLKTRFWLVDVGNLA